MQQEQIDGSQLKTILRLLADGEYHSGESLGELLGVSRAAVWKQLQKLHSLGIFVESVKGRGYQIPGGLELLDRAQICAGVNQNVLPLLGQLEIFSQIGSTNSYLLASQIGSGGVCLAEQQTAGRGRRGRQWYSPFGKNIYLSITWTFDGGVAALEGLSLVVGLAIVRALEGLGLNGVQLKWPNDLLFAGRKLAGILIEMTGDPAGECRAVIGVGINYDMDAEAVSEQQISQPWTDVKKLAQQNLGKPPGRNLLVAELLNQLLPLLDDYPEDRFSSYQQEWNSRCAFLGAPVLIHNGTSLQEGILLGVNEQGALRLMSDAGEKLIFGGEVSLRSLS